MNFVLPAFTGRDVVYVGNGRDKKSFETFITQLEIISSYKAIDKKDGPEYLQSLKDLDMSKTIVVKGAEIPGHMMPVAYTTATRLFFDCVTQLNVKTVGITGTKGKTTTSSLTAHILKTAGLDARLCGSVGESMLDNLTDTTSETVMIVELPSFQLAELRQSPDVAIITNLFRDHVDYHGSLETYWEAKRNIMRFMDENSRIIYNPKDEMVLHWLADSKAKQLPVDADEKVDMAKSQLIGDHNKFNYLMAKMAASLFGISSMTCLSALASFKPVRHRLQPVRTVRGVTFVDDAIGSTPEATVAGIKALIHNKGPIGCVMLGGLNKGYDYTDLIALLYRVGIPKLVFFPDTGPMIEKMLSDNYKPDTFHATDMDEAVQWAAENTPSGSICLLSTAAASSALWHSFEEKGSMFQKAVLDLPN